MNINFITTVKVNNKLNKNSPTFEEFVYNFKNRNNALSWTNILMVILVIIIILIFMHYTLGIL